MSEDPIKPRHPLIAVLLCGVIFLILLWSMYEFITEPKSASEDVLTTGHLADEGDVLLYGAFHLTSDSPEYDKVVLEGKKKVLYKNDTESGTYTLPSSEPVVTFDLESMDANNYLLNYEDAETEPGVIHASRALSEQYLGYLTKECGYKMECYIRTNSVVDCYLSTPDGTYFRYMYVRLTEENGITIYSTLKEDVVIPETLDAFLTD